MSLPCVTCGSTNVDSEGWCERCWNGGLPVVDRSKLYARLMAIAESFEAVAVKVDEGKITPDDAKALDMWLGSVEETLEALYDGTKEG